MDLPLLRSHGLGIRGRVAWGSEVTLGVFGERSGGDDRISERELHRAAVKGILDLSFAALLIVPFVLVAEWALRDLGFGAEDLTRTALWVGGLMVTDLLIYLWVRSRGQRFRHPFVLATIMVWSISLVGAELALATGGYFSPYTVVGLPILATWVLVMPGGARHSAPALIGGFVLFCGSMLWREPLPAEAPGRVIALVTFQSISLLVILMFSEVLHRFRVAATLASNTDALTGLMSRRYLLQRLEQLIALRKRRPAPVAAIVIDLDHFKRVNDTYGHDVGDAALRMVAGVMRKVTRSEDLCGRLGGEEFLLVLDECDPGEAEQVATRLRELVEASELDLEAARLRVTLSAGVAVAPSGHSVPSERLMRAADEALYEAKGAGRNCVRRAAAFA